MVFKSEVLEIWNEMLDLNKDLSTPIGLAELETAIDRVIGIENNDSFEDDESPQDEDFPEDFE